MEPGRTREANLVVRFEESQRQIMATVRVEWCDTGEIMSREPIPVRSRDERMAIDLALGHMSCSVRCYEGGYSVAAIGRRSDGVARQDGEYVFVPSPSGQGLIGQAGCPDGRWEQVEGGFRVQGYLLGVDDAADGWCVAFMTSRG